MASKQAACEWLDILLKDPGWKKFKIKGNNHDTPKLKVYLEVEFEWLLTLSIQVDNLNLNLLSIEKNSYL